MKFTAQQLISYFKDVGRVIEEKKDYLSELDRKLGDGDHGVTMSIGWHAVNETLDSELTNERDCGKISSAVGMTFLNAVGSSVGPLYATGFLRAAKVVSQKSELNDSELSQYWISFINGVKERGQSKVGDKTMIDTLQPALEVLESKSGDFPSVFAEAVQAAERGMKATVNLVSKVGRSSRLGERSKGIQDPGATSAYLLVATFLQTVAQ
ncbi:dihydroxyacetone kinase subunit DhaL [Alicyclobacillus sp. SO9]|uniref:dihydroxyacetone kinase subunit DhaL n=1 Tax=Alicyclobacillus sp. SO9 TaxID=2665646 RepID=UPI0018E7A3B5|nr:dihydroxyacetone kinase subunit DhaL [Alicyclobacillus sp. SO9]QQE80633.1 dihydroxyacetone kinase subunit L [Alicyclobacillus sp. SO9]